MEEKMERAVYFCFLLALHSPSVLKLDTTVSSETSAPVYQNIQRYMQDYLQTGRSGDRIPVGGVIFRTCPDRP